MTSTRGRRARMRPAAASRPSIEPRRRDYRSALILAAFAVTFSALAVGAYTRKSATWDEPIHLTSGYAALAHQDFRVDPSHPPLLRLWSALPAFFTATPSMSTATIDAAHPLPWLGDAYLFAHRFMYVENDADRLLYAGRFMTVLLGLVLGVFLFLWAREWLGLLPAAIALGLYTLEPNLLAHASLVTTDLGVTCFIFGATYFLWRTCRNPTPSNIAGLTTCFALAIVSKFSALLLAPIVGLLLAVAVARTRLSAARAGAIACGLVAASFLAIWTSYGFRYLPSESPSWRFMLHETEMARQAPALASVVRWIDGHELLPNAFTQGLFYTQASLQQMPAFLSGAVSADGWWYYFPAALLMKTPVALLGLTALGLGVFAWRRHVAGIDSALFVLAPPAVYLAVAMATGINIGLRHILPIYPFLILMAALGARELTRKPARTALAVMSVVAVAAVAEFGRAYPHPLSFFNHLVGGPENGHRLLSDSNLGWGQNLKPLKAWMDANRVSHVNLAYFGQADPEYYGIACTHLPGAPSFAVDAVARPRIPGYVAISSTLLTGVYAPPSWRLFYRPFQDLEPAAVVGHSIRVYWVERWPDAIGPQAGDANPDAHLMLADALLFGLQWPERALLHYDEYLKAHARDAEALMNRGMALVAVERTVDAIAAFRAAVDADGDHGRARLTLAKALLGTRDVVNAAVEAERAVALMPDDAEAHHLLGRVHAVRGRFGDAARSFERVLELQPSHGEAQEFLRRVRAASQSGARVAPLPRGNG